MALVLDAKVRKEALPEYTHLAFSVSPVDFEAMKNRIQSADAQAWQDNWTEGDSYYFLDPNGHKLEIHVGDLQSRIASAKREWGDEVEWYVSSL
jgi:hypothetical protein